MTAPAVSRRASSYSGARGLSRAGSDARPPEEISLPRTRWAAQVMLPSLARTGWAVAGAPRAGRPSPLPRAHGLGFAQGGAWLRLRASRAPCALANKRRTAQLTAGEAWSHHWPPTAYNPSTAPNPRYLALCIHITILWQHVPLRRRDTACTLPRRCSPHTSRDMTAPAVSRRASSYSGVHGLSRAGSDARPPGGNSSPDAHGLGFSPGRGLAPPARFARPVRAIVWRRIVKGAKHVALPPIAAQVSRVPGAHSAKNLCNGIVVPQYAD
jgi:hypothetical protein